jgi:GNAT superfamily N-acetyltransferase
MITAIASGHAQGMMAYAGDLVVGWCNAAPRSAFPTLADLPGDSSAIGATPCFIVANEWRGAGIAAKLLDAACTALADKGMKSMQGGPNKGAANAGQHSRGPLAMYLAAGYQEIAVLPDGTVVVEKLLDPGSDSTA